MGGRVSTAEAYEQALRRIAGPCEGERFDGSCLDFVEDPGWCAPCVATTALASPHRFGG